MLSVNNAIDDGDDYDHKDDDNVLDITPSGDVLQTPGQKCCRLVLWTMTRERSVKIRMNFNH